MKNGEYEPIPKLLKVGNAATNVSYPFSTICLAISLLVGIGSAFRVLLYLGNKKPEAAAKAAGNGIALMVVLGLAYLVIGEILLARLLKLFGAATEVFPYARQYAGITLVGMPFLIVTNGMSNLIRADGSPEYSMTCMIAGAIVNTILDPIFIFILQSTRSWRHQLCGASLIQTDDLPVG